MEDIIIEERPVPSVSKKEPVKVVEKKVKIKVKKQGPGVLSYLADWFNKSLIVFLLAALDFILFCGAGNLNIFRGAPWEFILEAQYILVGLFILSWLLMFAASLARFIQNLLAAGCVFLFVVIIMNQFALFDKASFLQAGAAEWLGNSAGRFPVRGFAMVCCRRCCGCGLAVFYFCRKPEAILCGCFVVRCVFDDDG